MVDLVFRELVTSGRFLEMSGNLSILNLLPFSIPERISLPRSSRTRPPFPHLRPPRFFPAP